jgi:hypothetical protein
MAGELQQGLAGIGQRNCPRISVKQGMTDVVLELPNLLRERRLSNP